MKLIDIHTAASRLHEASNLRVLAHAHPDGDTLGSAYALAHALRALGKDACVYCEDPVPAMFAFMEEGLPSCFLPSDPSFLICVDVADRHLLGTRFAALYGDKIDLNIDHHPTNTLFARETLLDPTAAAAAEVVSDLIDALSVDLDTRAAACLYAGISTDTGCFRYANTTARSHRLAARYIGLGVRTEPLDRAFFETDTRTYLALERMALESLRYYCKDRVALVAVTREMFARSGSNEEEFIKIVARVRQIEGVEVGVAIRQRQCGDYKISLRSQEPIDAAAICARMGGGGHARAAGCASELPFEETIAMVVGHIEEALEKGSCPSQEAAS